MTRSFVTSLISLAALVFVTGCAGLADMSRTAAIHEVKFEDTLNPAKLTVGVGDEVRWVNARSMTVEIDIPGLNKKMLSCARGFSNFIGQIQERIDLEPNASASLCFGKPLVVNYDVRMKSASQGGATIQLGAITVVATAP